MGKIVVSENVSLDGVAEDPNGEQGFKRGGWFVQFIGQDWEAWAELELAEAQGAEALLLGRRSDEYFATRSSSQSGEWVDRLNSLPNYVVSSTLERPKWTNATILGTTPGAPTLIETPSDQSGAEGGSNSLQQWRRRELNPRPRSRKRWRLRA